MLSSRPFIRHIAVACTLIISILSLSQSLMAQGGPSWQQMPIQGKVSGTIIDAASGAPLEYANVVLMKKDSVVSGALTGKDGAFALPVNKPGRYRVKLQFIGYKDVVKDSIFVTPRNPEVSLGHLSMGSSDKVLQEVVVTGHQSDFVQTVDKKVFSVDKSVMANGGSATDVLQQIPSVSLDVDGNVELRGSSNVTVLIDGKPSGLTGPNISAILEQIPANSIESIELITNPSVKYDPDGTSGIINIVLKKDRKAGLNGSATVALSNRDKYNGSASLNYKVGKFNVFTSYSYKHNNLYRYGNTYRANYFPDTTWYLNQLNSGNRVNDTHMGRLGFDYYLNNNNTISLAGTYTDIKGPGYEVNTFATQDPEYRSIQDFYREAYDTETNRNIDLTADYRHTFKQKGRLLTASLSYSNSSNQENESYRQVTTSSMGAPVSEDPYLQRISTGSPFQVASMQADYTQPLAGKAKLEAGYKTILRRTEQDFFSQHFGYADNSWLPDLNLNNSFAYKEGVHAAYAAYTNVIKSFTYQLGLRAEQAYTSSYLANTGKTYVNNYLSLFPNAQLMENLKNDQTIQLSFSRRINRPSLHALNPFPDYDDPLNFHSGNPYLKPEYVNSVEMGYSRFFKKFTLNGSLYYRYTTGMNTWVRTVDTTGIARTTVVNLNSSTNYGLELISRITPVKWWNLTLNFNFFHTYLNATNIESSLTNANMSWMGKILSTTYLPKGIQLQLTAFYHGPNVLPQGTMKPMYAVDAGLKKDVMKNKGSLAFNVSDIFNTRQFSLSGMGDNFYTSFMRKRESRIFTLSFTYRFGKTEESMRKNKKMDNGGENSDFDGF